MLTNNYYFIFNNFFLFSIENPIDPPKPEGDPFDIEVLPKRDFKLEIEGGVVKVKNSDGTPHSKFVYPELKMFIDDYHLLVNLISNGPL